LYGNRSSEIEGDSLQAAAGHVGRCLRPNGEASESEWKDAYWGETNVLVSWAESNRLVIPLCNVVGRSRHDGAEHGVWYNEGLGRWFKLTHRGKFGGIPELGYALDKKSQGWRKEFILRQGTPGEYLVRMTLGNQLFGDDVQLEGVVQDNEHARILISQGHIEGKAPNPEEINTFMINSGFLSAPDFAWYNPSSGIAAFDALARNFLRTSDSDILPIDLILTPVEGPLREYFEEVT
jgi:hypothetical protein